MSMIAENGVLFALFASLFTWLMTAVGASTVFLSSRFSGRALIGLSGFSAGIMLASCFFSLLLPAIRFVAPMPVFIPVVFGILLGCAFVHLGTLVPEKGGGDTKSSWLLFTAVTLHNIPEGLAVGIACGAASLSLPAGLSSAVLLMLGVGVENIPEGACVAYPVYLGGSSPKKSFVFSTLSGAVEVPASVLGAVVSTLVTGIMPWALSFAAGAMLYVVCFELLPENGEKNPYFALGTVVGFCLITCLDLIWG